MFKTCIFGGAFDPIHLGHIKVANEACKRLCIDRFIWVPTFAFPHKTQSRTAYEHRLQMIQLTLKKKGRHIVSDIESALPVPSYTINTFHALKNKFGSKGKWYLLIGADNWKIFNTWYKWETLMKEIQIIIFPRENSLLKHVPDNIQILPVKTLKFTSTKIREQLKTNIPLENTGVLPEIKDYILSNHLFGR